MNSEQDLHRPLIQSTDEPRLNNTRKDTRKEPDPGESHLYSFDPSSRRKGKFHRFTAIAAGVFAAVILAGIITWIVVSNNGSNDEQMVIDEATVYLAESMPTNINLPPIPGVGVTWEAQIRLVNSTRHSLDITAMYWNLIASNSGSNTTSRQFTPDEFAAMGAQHGQDLFNAFIAAAARGVHIRIIQGLLADNTESTRLQQAYPDMVSVQTWNSSQWYGGGIMHQKIFIFDHKHLYVGSANMDWLSLSQVKEMGIVFENSPTVAGDYQKLFDVWWGWTGNAAVVSSRYYSELAWSSVIQMSRWVPCWSYLVPTDAASYCSPPFDAVALDTTFTRDTPLVVTMNGNVNTSTLFATAGPPEATTPNRVFDEDGLAWTISQANRTVCLSVMDFLPASMYSGGHGPQPVRWNRLFDALLLASTSKGVNVRLLISHWNHSDARIPNYLNLLVDLANACKDWYSSDESCNGNITVRIFEVPGWNATTGVNAQYPPYSRVNHAKYIVTDNRINIGTSNLSWDYMFNTAGTSVNTDDAGLRAQLQAVFDRDWDSPYAYPLESFPLS